MAKIAVTGSEGFIGSHLVEALVERGDTVRALVQYNSFSSCGWLEDLPDAMSSEIEVVFGDVRDGGQMMSLMDGVDAVCHLAALIAIPYSYEAPASYLATNAGGTLNVLEAVRAHGTPRLVHTSTSEVYGTAVTVPIHETHPLQAQSPYSASKIAADKLVESVPPQLRGPRRHPSTVQHLRSSPVGPGRHPLRHHPDRRRSAADPTSAPTDRRATSTSSPTPSVPSWRCSMARPRSSAARSTPALGASVTIAETVRIIADVMDVDVEVVTDPQRVRPRGRRCFDWSPTRMPSTPSPGGSPSIASRTAWP